MLYLIILLLFIHFLYFFQKKSYLFSLDGSEVFIHVFPYTHIHVMAFLFTLKMLLTEQQVTCLQFCYVGLFHYCGK